MRGIVFLGNSQYDVLTFFAEEMAKGFEEKGCEVIRVDRSKENYMEILSLALSQEYDFIFDIDGMLMENDRLYQYFNNRYVAFLVDHPMYHRKRLLRQHSPYFVTVVDEDHKRHLEKYYTHLDRVHFQPHGGMAGKQIEEYENRSIEVLFLGSYENPKTKMENANLIPAGIRELIIDTCKQLEKEPQLTMEQALLQQLELRQIKMSDAEFAEIMSDLVYIDEYVRSYYRDRVIRTLGEANIPVEIYGNGWENFDGNCYESIQIHESVSYQKSLELMGQSKMVLNVMPWFKEGSHERVFTTMLNGALCITDKSKYLEQILTDEQNVLFYDLHTIEKLPALIRQYLEDNDKGKKVALNGKQEAEHNHTWRKRGHELLDWIMEEASWRKQNNC